MELVGNGMQGEAAAFVLKSLLDGGQADALAAHEQHFLARKRKPGLACGVDFRLDVPQALNWLETNRPDLYHALGIKRIS
ncbi:MULTISPECIES: hypothetical protein [unclassified Variovorax]|uniref:hypothetical protein n=1 Tax=unclassified Variovorax TaxID=663243 RepID=UPI000A6A05F0|nr:MULTISPECIES: hypothetical protein [unclassified Variovorax]PNG50112.1 hypothetical protein CHC06_05735 [Variovorax sp. B2]PNG50984.1 hypothetical protein CHC07_05640 [Variovorax sp. B4]VTV17146.1 hypothetical protein WDL1P1_00149 [Variovorax sp. WDL1]